MLILLKLHRYNVSYGRLNINNNKLGWCKTHGIIITYYTNKYHMEIIHNRLLITIKVYNQKYQLLYYNCYHFNNKYNLLELYTSYYELTKTHMFYKMYNMSNIKITYKYSFRDSHPSYIMTFDYDGNSEYLCLRYDSDNNIQFIWISSKSVHGNEIIYDGNKISYIKIDDRKYIKG